MKRLLASELCSRDWRGPSGQVSSLKSTPYQNFCAGFFWENSSGKLGLKAGTAWPDRWHPLVMGSGLLLNLSPPLPLLPWVCLSMPASRDSPSPPCAETAVLWCFFPTSSCWISLLSVKPSWATSHFPLLPPPSQPEGQHLSTLYAPARGSPHPLCPLKMPPPCVCVLCVCVVSFRL